MLCPTCTKLHSLLFDIKLDNILVFDSGKEWLLI